MKVSAGVNRAAQTPQRNPSGREPAPSPGNLRRSRTWLTFLVIIALNYFVMRWLVPGADEAITIPYTAFKQQVAAGNVEAIYSKGASIEGRFEKAVTWPPPGKEDAASKAQREAPLGSLTASGPRTAETCTTTLPAFVDPGVLRILTEHTLTTRTTYVIA
jgi:cell division protease FtsH